MADGAIGGYTDNGVIGGGRAARKRRRLLMVALICAALAFLLTVALARAEVSGPVDITATRAAPVATARALPAYALAFGAAVLIAGGMLRLRRLRRE